MAQDRNDESKPLLAYRGHSRLETGDLDSNRTFTSDPLYGLSRPKRRAACTAIITTEMFERLAFYGLTANLVLFLNGDPFSWLAYEAANTLLIFLGITYMCSVLGGWIADTMLGRFKTILISFVIYICGAALLILVGYASWKDPVVHSNDKNDSFITLLCGFKTACPVTTDAPIGPVEMAEGVGANIGTTATPDCPRQHYCGKVILPALLLIAIGTGSIRSNLSPFGADQVCFD